MRHIQTEINIAARPELIWKVLMDFENYPNWNPFIKSIQGAKAVGETLTVKIEPPGSKLMTFKPEILVLDMNRELKWFGKAGIKGIFNGEHYFQLEKQSDGSTNFSHGEKFKGILVGLMKKTLDKTEIGFQQMNEALKKQCENRKQQSSR